MAFTWTVAEKTVFGNLNVQQGVVVADAAAGAINTGLGSVAHVQWSPKSMTTAAGKCAINALSAGTSAAGYIAVTGVASGDELFVTVFGR